ncbi:AraC family transcriptional regulator [uncultured Lactobacillus sp.]|uniref:helix-turn-helix domain-containing protein n=1 Tax=uncultured Lactobacillus sp. TaxID=153152 RepID=UPI0026056AEB|nr:AraC family transcriptional regulator [uncultured Lactobacillus sp.]
MEQAKEILANTDEAIQSISQLVGYSDEFTFSKAFKRYSAFSPKPYRQSLKE